MYVTTINFFFTFTHHRYFNLFILVLTADATCPQTLKPIQHEVTGKSGTLIQSIRAAAQPARSSKMDNFFLFDSCNHKFDFIVIVDTMNPLLFYAQNHHSDLKKLIYLMPILFKFMTFIVSTKIRTKVGQLFLIKCHNDRRANLWYQQFCRLKQGKILTFSL